MQGKSWPRGHPSLRSTQDTDVALNADILVHLYNGNDQVQLGPK